MFKTTYLTKTSLSQLKRIKNIYKFHSMIFERLGAKNNFSKFRQHACPNFSEHQNSTGFRYGTKSLRLVLEDEPVTFFRFCCSTNTNKTKTFFPLSSTADFTNCKFTQLSTQDQEPIIFLKWVFQSENFTYNSWIVYYEFQSVWNMSLSNFRTL